MACVLSRNFKEFDHGTVVSTNKMFPVVQTPDFGSYPQSAVSYTYALATIKWTLHFSQGSTSTNYGYIHCTSVYYMINGATTWTAQIISPNNYGGVISGVINTVGSGYVGLDITFSQTQNLAQQYALYAEGNVSFFN